jgi:predicted Rossmann-fold nucleotide-binding protein
VEIMASHTRSALLVFSALALGFSSSASWAERRPVEGKGGPAVVGPRGNPLAHLPRADRLRVVIGVMGSAGGKTSAHTVRALRDLGTAIATSGSVILTGACPGLPNEAVVAAKKAGGRAVGISPWSTLSDHRKAGSPVEGFDVLQLTQLPSVLRGQRRPNYMGREIDNIVRSDVVVVAGGRTGTLGEFAIAIEERRPVGVLLGTGGISGELKRVLQASKRAGKQPGAPVLFDHDPSRLVKRLLKAKAALDASGATGPLGERI